MWKFLKILGGALIVVALGGGLYINSQRTAIIEKALTKAEETASKTLGVPVKIGAVDFNNVNFFDLDRNSDITVRDIEIFDKQDELLAKVETADINFKLLALTDDPVAAIDVIKLDNATLNLKQRGENSWNVNDLKLAGEGESTFDAKIFLTNGTVNADFDNKNISVEEISAEADCADMNAIPAQIAAKIFGANVNASGTLSKAQQVVNAQVDAVNFDKLLPFLPEDKIPDGVEILGGKAENFSVHLLHNDETLSYLGSTEVKGASVKVEQTDVENINGNVTFNEREIILDASAAANGQFASASGKIRLDTDEIFFDIYAQSDSFAPAAIISDIGIEGSAAVQAHLVGTAKNPQVDADIYSDRLAYENLSAQNISTKFRYVGDMIYLSDTSANLFGGYVTGTAEIKTEDFSFNAHVKADRLDAATLCEFSGSENVVDGKIFADVGINGNTSDLETFKIYGNARASDINFQGLYINDANASFYFTDDDLTIDYLSAKLPDNGSLGLEGTITDITDLNLNFYGAHVDMSQLKKFNDLLDMSGLADFKGTVKGDADNPYVTLDFSAVDNSVREGDRFKGTFFKQPFDSIQLAASGSLDGVHIDKFNLDKDGKLKWTVIEGSVGLTGEKNLNLQLDTSAVRAEDIAAFVAPDQEITGNVSNTVKITGSIDNPIVAGNIKFKRGSYRGVLLSGMQGDYFLEGDILRVQDFEITSPMIDIVLNGTINKNTHEMDFVVEGKDIRLERFQSKLPENYIAEGHTTFEGTIKGTPEVPIFDGELSGEEIFLNGVKLLNVYGHLSLNGSNLYLNDFRFSGEETGSCKMQLGANLDSETLSGDIDLSAASIANLCTIFNQKNNLVEGSLDSRMIIGGTFAKPQGSLSGEIISGTFAGYDVHDLAVEVGFRNNTVYINRLEGKQGDKGSLQVTGTANLVGALDLNLIAKNIELGMFTAAAGYDFEVVGMADILAKVGGTVDNPFAEVLLTAKGGINGSTFDNLTGHFLLNDWRVNVEQLIVQRELGGKLYGASAEGFIPLKALTARSKDMLPANEQLDLIVSLDGADLSLLPVLSKQIAWGVGELDGSVKITGTAGNPLVNGKISLIDGSVKLKPMKSLIEHINISTLFNGDRFDVENFSGNIGAGTFALDGYLTFPNLTLTDYNFDFAAVDLDIDADFYKGLLNANFNFSEKQMRDWKRPCLSGQINIDKCRFNIPSLPEDDTPLPEVLLDVTLNLGDKVHFYKSRLYDMYFTGNAHFGGSTNHPKTSGIINVKRGGTLTYLESVFNIREGEAHFNQVDTFMPSVRFLAETKIDRTKIYLSVNGSPDNMNFRLTSSPEMTETEIMQLLTLREAYANGEGNLTTADALAIGLQMTVIAEIEDALKRTLGIDQLKVSRGSGSLFEKHRAADQNANERDKDYNFTVGKYIGDNFMVRYTHGFGSHKVNRYGIQYDFNDNFGMTIEREGKDYIFSVEARFKF